MKLDRNTNRGGHGKYALLNMRKLIPIIERLEGLKSGEIDNVAPNWPTQEEIGDVDAFNRLVKRGVISLGNETPGDQFFVMKYKDKFTAGGLYGYATSVINEAEQIRNGEGETLAPYNELREYGAQILTEAATAQKLGNRIPD